MKLDPYLMPYTKINPKWIRDLNVRPKYIKSLAEKRVKSSYIGFGNDFLAMTPKAQAIKGKTSRLDYIKI